MSARLCGIAALAVLAGCATAPPPSSALDTARTGARFANAAAADALQPVPPDWWKLFRSSELDELVQRSLAAHADLRAAYARLDASRALLKQSRQARWPAVGVESGLRVDDTSTQPSAAAVPSTDWDVALTASWDIDLFGRLRHAALAARADAAAQAAAVDAVRVAVVADTVQAYMEYCAASQGNTQARDIAAASDSLTRLTRVQLESGDVSPLELAQVATLAAQNRAMLPVYEAQRDNALYRLAVLQGRTPAEGPRTAPACSRPPDIDGPLPVGDGAALLLRRPDLREAERKLAAAAARVGVSRAELYPQLNLGAAAGILAGSFDAALTPLLTWSVPGLSPARARLEQARANERAALAEWDGAVLNALREVETALSLYARQVRRRQELLVAETEAAHYATRAAARVQIGDAAGLVRIDAERALAVARLQRIQGDLDVALAQVALFRSLGGGWSAAGALP